MKSYKLWITGKVQGVWYRATAKKQAEQLGVMGYIENEHDGSVYAEAEGDPEHLDSFVAWCKEGSQFASVKEVRAEPQEPKGYVEFEIKR